MLPTKALTQSERLKFFEIYQRSFFIDHLWTSGVENYHQHMLQVSLAFSKSRNEFIPHYFALHQQTWLDNAYKYILLLSGTEASLWNYSLSEETTQLLFLGFFQ